MAILHAFTSTKADGADPAAVQPSDWNEPHFIESRSVSLADLALEARGIDYLGGLELGIDAVSTGALTVAGRDILMVSIRVIGLSAASAVALRFNGNAAATYWWSGLRQTTATAGTFNQGELGGDTKGQIHPFTQTTHSNHLVVIGNVAGVEKVAACLPAVATANVAAAPLLQSNGMGWFVTAGVITSIELVTTVAGVTMGAGCALGAWGKSG